MAKKEKEENIKKRSLRATLFKLAVAIAAVYLVVSFVAGQFQLAEKQRELEELDQQLEQQVEVNQELQRIMETDDEDAYVERVAREQLGYVRPNEKVFIDITGE